MSSRSDPTNCPPFLSVKTLAACISIDCPGVTGAEIAELEARVQRLEEGSPQ